jgi:hypothetical protein
MMLLLLLPVALLAAEKPAATPTQPAPPKKNAVLDPVKDVDALLPAEANQRAHVLFVNVGNALPESAFREAAAYVRMKYLLNVAVHAEPTPFAQAVVTDTGVLKQRFGKHALIVVAVVKQKQGPSFINVPGFFAQVNLRGLDKDRPEELFLKKRTRQMLLKGLAHACGIGATIDNMCVMFCNSFTLEGMDRVSATYGPNAYFSMRELLKELGGNDIFAQW